MRRTVFNEDHEAFRQVLRDFIEAEVTPHYQEWYDAGIVPRDFYYKLAELGLFGIEVPEEYGGAGVKSFKYSAVESEETARAAVSFGAYGAHVALCLPYLLKLGTEEQKKRWMPGFISGETMFAIPWPISSTLGLCLSLLMRSETTADISDSMAPSIVTVSAVPSNAGTSIGF